MSTHKGSCHCGAVTYEIEAEDVTSVLQCNCSHCSKKGLLLVFIPREQFTLQSGAGNLTEYRFNKKTIEHLFCQTCGVQGFAYGTGPEGNKTAAINVRCLDGFDIEQVSIKPFNGRDF